MLREHDIATAEWSADVLACLPPAGSAYKANGMEWNGMEWNGMEWNGVEWSGVEWNGIEWNGTEWNARPPR